MSNPVVDGKIANVGPPPVDSDRQYHEAFEMLRTEQNTLVSESTVLSLLLVTMLGFAIERQSFGIAAAALFVYVAKILVLMKWKHRADSLLKFAQGLENGEGLTRVLRGPKRDFINRWWHRVVVVVVACAHLAVVVWLINETEWTFAGS